MLIACIVVYFIAYSPSQVFTFGGETLVQDVSYSTLAALNALVYANSAVNPILYTVFSAKFRRQFVSLITVFL